MKNLVLTIILAIVTITAQAQLTYTMPDKIPEYNGTYEDFGQHHFFYPNGGEIRYANKDRTSTGRDVAFYTKFTYPRQYLLTDNNLAFVFAKRDTTTHTDSLHRVDLKMYGSNTSAFLARVDTQNTCVLNYFDQFFGAAGRTNVKGGAAIVAQNIYTNIDMMYCSNNTGLKVFYVVWPGGNPNDIVVQVAGAKSNAISGSDLIIQANWSSIKLEQPKMYQYTLLSNVVTPVTVCNAAWTNIATDKYRITTSSTWNSALPLIIEVRQGQATQSQINSLKWSTYFGGGMNDYIYRAKSDANNNLYTAGWTISSDFPQATGATPLQALNQAYDGFMSKFNPAGQLQWTTYIGGSGSEWIKDFEFTGSDLLCVGHTESFDAPIKSKTGAFNNALFSGGAGDGFIFQLSNTGNTNNWFTYYGGDGDDEFKACKFDSSGNFYIAGSSNSTNMTLVGSTGTYQQNFNSTQQLPAPAPAIHDAIIMKLNASGSLNWFTFYGTDIGSNTDDEFWRIDISGSEVYACGKAGGTNLPGAINTKILGGSYTDGIIAHFSTAGILNAGKYISGSIKNNSIKVFNGKVYTCGYGKSGGTPVNSGLYYYDGTCASGDLDAMFSVHNLDLSTTIHNTFLGGSAQDAAMDLQFSPNGVFYITGDTRSNNFPTTLVSNGYTSSYVNADDYFLSAFKEGVAGMIWSTYLGGQGDETDQAGECATIALDGQHFLHLAGTTNSYNTFPVDNNNGLSYFQPQRSGSPMGYSYDATITRFDLTSINIVAGLKDEKSLVSFGLYPNPATKYLLVDNEMLLNQNLKYSIYNMAGQRLLDGVLNTNDHKTIDVSSLHPGIYIINIGNDAKTFSNKFIKTDN